MRSIERPRFAVGVNYSLRSRVLFVAILFGISGCNHAEPLANSADQSRASSPSLHETAAENEAATNLTANQVAGLFGSVTAMQTICQPDAVEAYRLAKNKFNEHALDDYQIVGKPIPLPRTMAADFSSTFADAATYDFASAKACEPDYGVRLRFVRGSSTVDLLLCLECRLVAVYADSRRVGQEDFDGATPRIIGLVKQIFPDDAEIQAVP